MTVEDLIKQQAAKSGYKIPGKPSTDESTDSTDPIFLLLHQTGNFEGSRFSFTKL